MQIANPIYDVVFKYLMQDNKVAKLILSAIIGEEIEELEMRPQETAVNVERKDNTGDITYFLSVIRIDFSAKIRTEAGSQKLVIIEIQKAKMATDIMRFRKYLGEQYANDNYVEERAVEYKKALPIISIYFLGHTLAHTKAPVIKVNRQYIDIATGEEIQQKEEFIESLTHDSYVIQIPYLKTNRRNDLELLLSVFDQSQCFDEKRRHLLDIDDAKYPEKYRDVIRRLVAVFNEPEIRKKIETEDAIMEEFAILDEELAKKKQEITEKDKELSEKDKELSEKDKELSEKDKELSEKDKELSEKDKELSEKDREIEKTKDVISEKEKELAKKEEELEEMRKLVASLKNKNN